jgi:Heterokaryon incompatibility protein (HET)
MADQSPSAFSGLYKPLPSGFIRLLKVQSGNGDPKFKPIQRDIVSRSGNPPKYTALSYTWQEDPQLECDVYESSLIGVVDISGFKIRVQDNLWWFLELLARKRCTRCHWIDAICINQDDITERNHQVQRMAEIYQKAKSVTV